MNSPSRRNPFVGPRPFKKGETLYGRDREILELLDLLIAERIVLLYSPSGAGKTSLIQAGLLPKLADENFQVLPAMRVSLKPHQEQSGKLPSNENRYVLSALLSLEELWPAAKQIPLPELARISLAEYLERWQFFENNSEQEQSVMLVFDQFEEILTVDPVDHEGKTEFFTQLGAALRQPNWSALFAMREEFLAGLEPYLRHLPTRLKNTFRLDLLTTEAACNVMRQSADAGGIPFAPSAAQKLADDLCSIQVQQADGALEERKGAYVEPVQLQVVCYQLWEHLPEGTPRIEETHLQAAGDVNAALAAYYADCVNAAAEQTGVQEKQIREWVATHLITKQGIRGQVLGGSEQSQELKSAAITHLMNAHVVRAERRRGATWYELAHDRLIKPIRKDNETWFQQHLSLLQRQAALWQQHRESADLLFSGESLADAEKWVAEQQPILSEHEQKFLDACRKTRQQADKEEKSQTIIDGLKWVAILAGVVAIIFFFLVDSTARKAQKNELRASLTSAHNLFLSRQDELGALFAAVNVGQRLKSDYANEGLQWQAAFHLRDILAGIHEKNRFESRSSAGVMSVAFSRDGTLLASGGMDKRIRLWSVPNGEVFHLFTGHTKAVYSVRFSPDGKRLASGSQDRTVKLWNVADGTFVNFTGHKSAVYGLSFNRKGTRLASSDIAGKVIVWTVPDGARFGTFSTLGGNAWSVAFSPDGERLAASHSKYIRIWNVTDGTFQKLSGHAAQVRSVAFSPDGNILASGSEDRTIKLWNMDTMKLSATLAHSSVIRDVAFLPDGTQLASGGDDGTLTFWDVNSHRALKTFAGHRGWVRSLSVSPDGLLIASGGQDRTVKLWNIRSEEERQTYKGNTFARANSASVTPDGQAFAWIAGNYLLFENLAEDSSQVPPKYVEEITSVGISPDGQRLASGQSNGTITFRKTPFSNPSKTFIAHEKSVDSLDFSPDGRFLASGSQDRTVKLWNAADGMLFRTFTGHAGAIRSLDFSDDGTWLASGGDDKKVKLWKVRHKAVFSTLSGYDNTVRSLDFSHNGQWLASGGGNRITFWNMTSNQKIPKKVRGDVNSLSFSPDDRFLASGNDNSMITIWSVPELVPLGTLKGHTDAVIGVKFTNMTTGGVELVSASQDEVFKRWRVGDLDESLRLGCEYLQDYLRNNPNVNADDGAMCDDILKDRPTD